MKIKLTVKQWSTLSLCAHPVGFPRTRRGERTYANLERRGLIVGDEHGVWFATEKGRAVLEVIETGRVVMFNT